MNARDDDDPVRRDDPAAATQAPPRGAKGARPQYFDDPEVGRLLSIVLALTGEVCVMRDRMDTIERLLAAGVPVSAEAIDAYLPDESVRAQRDARRQEFLSVVLRVIHEERAALERRTGGDDDYDRVIAEIARS